MRQTEVKGWIKLSAGRSVEGREIPFYGLETVETAEALDILIFGAFHGDEPESEVLTRQFMEGFDLERFAGYRVGIVPLVNPDGLTKNQRVNANGVDLNRNFPTADWAELNAGEIYYSGKAPGSEPETKFMLMLLEQYPPQRIVSVHTPYRVLNYDGPGKALAETMAEANGYSVVEDIGYATPGSFGTYVGKERGIPTVTVELCEKEEFTAAELTNNIEALCRAISFLPPM
jgi:murein peptide amidase A